MCLEDDILSDEIWCNCDLFINGHLHNGSKITNKIINVGNLTGQNFSEDAFKYDHCIFILDTTTLQIAVYENPYAINFYKIELWDVTKLKQNAVITLKCEEQSQSHYKELLLAAPNVLTSRLIVIPTSTDSSHSSMQELIAVNHLDKFKDYVLDVLGTNEIIVQELEEVLK